jgi:hypothetical protein
MRGLDTTLDCRSQIRTDYTASALAEVDDSWKGGAHGLARVKSATAILGRVRRPKRPAEPGCPPQGSRLPGREMITALAAPGRLCQTVVNG